MADGASRLGIRHPFALGWSTGLHRQRPGFDGLSPNGGGWRMVWCALPIPHPFRLSLSKASHGLRPSFDGLSPNGWVRTGVHGGGAVFQNQRLRQNLACSPTVTVRSAPGVTHARLYELV